MLLVHALLTYLVFFVAASKAVMLRPMKLNEKTIEDNLDVIEEVVDFLEENISGVDIDVAVGIMAAQRNLQLIIGTHHHLPSRIQRLTLRCRTITDRFFNLGMGNHHHSPALIVPLSNWTLWKAMVRPLRLFSGDINYRLNIKIENDNSEQIGLSSDNCILNILQKNCSYISSCAKLANLHSTRGLLHLILSLQFKSSAGCNTRHKKTEDWLIEHICRRMLFDLRTTRPRNIEQLDNVMESVAICGAIAGYQEFGVKAMQRAVRTYICNSGCFSTTHKYKRNNNPLLGIGCGSHLMAVTLPTFAFFVRVSLLHNYRTYY